ncbi:MAG: oxygen-independent coproporphyrinogen III oxidase-like protein [Gammaproteobacteria bacterium]|nr:oxygen-independent coproporphyrinogen III oxidase-like protein [Gammaproteobacteria bacterium]
MNFDFHSPLPLALYAHIPWCVRKCPYCDFNSHEKSGALPEDAYVDALIADLEQDLPRVWGRRVTSVFIGGGTPSLFSPEAIDRLLAAVRARLICQPDMEITLEANPGTVEAGRFAEFRAAGVNRLSIGVQSFDDDKLKALGRIHGRDQAIRAAEQAHAAGFKTFNLDLMHGLPGQDLAQAMADLELAMSLKPTHLSWYQLTLEPNTVFAKRPPVLPEDEVLWDIQEAGWAKMAENGYAQYEVSAFAQEGHHCRHNANYWSFGDYLGIGAGAHGKLTDLQYQRAYRTTKKKNPKDYLDPAKPFLAEEVDIAPREMPFEFMLNALRLNAGLPISLYSERSGLPLAGIAPVLSKARDKGLLDADPSLIKPTETGHRFLNDLLELFLPDNLPKSRIIPIAPAR